MTHRISFRTVTVLVGALLAACSGTNADHGTGGSGGTTGSQSGGDSGAQTGGANGSGGSPASGSGGKTGSGGGNAIGSGGSGGTTAHGGAMGAGGATASGGMTGSGGAGAGAASGGKNGSGGTIATGGDKGAGGAVTTGGATGAGGTSSPGACTGTAGGPAATTLTVDADSAEDTISNGIYGLLMERLGKNWSGGLFVGTSSSIPNTDGMRNDVIQAFKDAGVGTIEWPGGCAAGSYNWSTSKNPSNDVGTDRYLELCSLLGIPPLIAGPGTSSAAANNLAWIKYINDNPDHPDWTLDSFKVGNEVWGCGGNQDEATYEANFLANYAMLSAPVNGKQLKLIASTGLIGNWTWLDSELKNLAGKIDGIEIHDYIYHPSDIPNVGFTDDQYYNVVNAANEGQIGPRITQIITYLDKYDPNKRIKIYEDEWGDWLKPFNSAADGWLQQGTVMDAISAAESLHLFMQHADRYQMAGLAQGVNVIHSLLLARSSDGALVKTPTYYVFKMFLPHHSANARWAPNTLVSEQISGNGKTFPVVSAGTTVDDQGRINVSLANVDLTNSRNVAITVESSKTSYVVSSARVITGPAKDSYNDYGQAEKVDIQPLSGSSCVGSGKSVQVTLPSKSVTMLVLTPVS